MRKAGIKNRQERIGELMDPVPNVIAVTGTPIYGRVAHLYPIWDIISKGLAGRPFFDFDVRYTGAHKGEHGWVNSGRTAWADTELKYRMKIWTLRRSRAEIMPNMPPKQRQVIRIDVPQSELRVTAAKAALDPDGLKSHFTRRLAATFQAKLPTVISNVVAELLESPNVADIDAENPPRKVAIVAFLRSNAEAAGGALREALAARDHANRAREVNAKLFIVHGGIDEQTRFNMARAFREHPGAAAWIATMDAIPGAISLKGAQTVHFAELHYSPSLMLQVEDRSYERGIDRLALLYYVARGTSDESGEAKLLPKMQTLEKMMDEEGAVDFQSAFAAHIDRETLGELADRLTAHLED